MTKIDPKMSKFRKIYPKLSTEVTAKIQLTKKSVGLAFNILLMVPKPTWHLVLRSNRICTCGGGMSSSEILWEVGVLRPSVTTLRDLPPYRCLWHLDPFLWPFSMHYVGGAGRTNITRRTTGARGNTFFPSTYMLKQAQLRLCKLGPGTVLIFYMSLAPLQYKYKDLP